MICITEIWTYAYKFWSLFLFISFACGKGKYVGVLY